MTVIDPKRCPLCGHVNQCGMAQGKGACWCFGRAIPHELLERLPPEARDVTCICETCVSGFRDAADALQRMQELLRRHSGSS